MIERHILISDLTSFPLDKISEAGKELEHLSEVLHVKSVIFGYVENECDIDIYITARFESTDLREITLRPRRLDYLPQYLWSKNESGYSLKVLIDMNVEPMRTIQVNKLSELDIKKYTPMFTTDTFKKAVRNIGK